MSQLPANPPPDSTPSLEKQPSNYTAILYFHGIGTPRRHEQLSQLTDALDQFAETQDYASVGRLRAQTADLEPSRVNPDDTVAFIKLSRVVKRFQKVPRAEGNYRVYEAYWSPSMAGGSPSLDVLFWLLFSTLVPFLVLFSPWRAYQRIRLTTLYRLFERSKTKQFDPQYQELESHYRDFETWEVRRIYRQGGIAQFMRYLIVKLGTRSRYIRFWPILSKWFFAFVREQLRFIALSLTILLGILDLLVIAIAFATTWIDILFPTVANVIPFVPQLAGLLQHHHNALFAVSGLAVIIFFSIRHQLIHFWSDAMFWTTFKEKDPRFQKRREILKHGEQMIEHLLRDDNCSRIVVVGYSLGSAIAQECLMQIGRRDRAWRGYPNRPIHLDRLNRISHLITIGSPIDRLYYLFEIYDGGGHRYNRISEQLRGDVSDPPFRFGKQKGTEWINIWDDADPISSKLFTFRSPIPNRNAIQNFQTFSSHRPNLVGAHNDYLFSYSAMRLIFWITMFGRLPKGEPTRSSFGETVALAFRVLAWAGALCVPWIAALLIVGIVYKSVYFGLVGIFALSAAVAMFLFLQIMGAAVDWSVPVRVDHINRINLKKAP